MPCYCWQMFYVKTSFASSENHEAKHIATFVFASRTLSIILEWITFNCKISVWNWWAQQDKLYVLDCGPFIHWVVGPLRQHFTEGPMEQTLVSTENRWKHFKNPVYITHSVLPYALLFLCKLCTLHLFMDWNPFIGKQGQYYSAAQEWAAC